MDIQFCGAAGEVTGSCHLVRVGRYQILLDCGLVQGSPKDEARNREPFPFDASTIDAVILSHAHIDHSGRLPLLVKAGFRGPIYTQRACRDLCRIMLKDAGFLNEKDAEWENHKRQRKGLAFIQPLYTQEDAKIAINQFKSVDYDAPVTILPGVTLRLADAGHILGSAIVELALEEDGDHRKLVFSGDLGHAGAPILRDPSIIRDADIVLMESTYGDRLHASAEDTRREMQQVLEQALHGHGNILIPAFAVGRTQELLYLFGRQYQDWNLAKWYIALDSPMAIQATEVYIRHSDLYDSEARALFKQNRQLPWLPNLHFSRTPTQSMALNKIQSGAMIIAASGMCTGGRIKHHLKHNVWRKDCHIVIVGFQARGTTGRALVDGASHIRLWGETVKVNAKVHTIGGFSAHADQAELMTWYSHFHDRPRLMLVHGEVEASEALAQKLRGELNAPVKLATLGQRLDLRRLQ